MAKVRNRFQTRAIEVCLPFNFAVAFDFYLFPFPPSKAKWKGNVLVNRQNAAIRSMVFSLFYDAHCLRTVSSCVSTVGNARRTEKNPRNKIAKLYTGNNNFSQNFRYLFECCLAGNVLPSAPCGRVILRALPPPHSSIGKKGIFMSEALTNTIAITNSYSGQCVKFC